MSRFQYQVAGGVDESAFPLCIRPPQDVNDMASLFCQAVDYGSREFFPTFILARAGLVCTNRQGCIEKQDALVRPPEQIAGLRHGFD